MSEQPVEQTPIEEVEENEPVFYNPKTLGIIAGATEWIAWIVLAGYIIDVIAQVFSLNNQTQGASLSALFAQAGASVVVPYLIQNFLVPFLTGLTFFMVLLGVANGLNVLREIEFNQRESK